MIFLCRVLSCCFFLIILCVVSLMLIWLLLLLRVLCRVVNCWVVC